MNIEITAAFKQDNLVKELLNDGDESLEFESDSDGFITEDAASVGYESEGEWAPLTQYPKRNQAVNTQTGDNNRNMEMPNDNDESLEFGSTLGQRYIYRVPRRIRSVNEKVYTPELISIGPLHHDKKKLFDMEKKKEKYVKSFFQKLPTEKTEKIGKIQSFVKNNEKRIRDCYAEAFPLESPEFVKMILYDSIFIIEILLKVSLDDKSDKLLLDSREAVSILRTDFQLLENQLPYFVLEEIYKFASVDTSLPPLVDLCVNFFGKFMGVGLSALTSNKVKHFTDWRRMSLLEGYPSVPNKKRVSDVPCATKLDKSGLKFKSIEIKPGQSVLDVKFEANELQVPRLEVYYSTERLLRNIMALEQYLYRENAHVCNYVELMDYLINDEKDVDLLVENGIISNKALVATMFNELNQNVLKSESSYHKLCKQLKEHYKNPWNRAKTTLKRVYFSNPWRGTATVAAIILLFLAITQTLCSILQVV